MATTADENLSKYLECLNLADMYTRRMNKAVEIGNIEDAKAHIAKRNWYYDRAKSYWTAYETCREDK